MQSEDPPPTYLICRNHRLSQPEPHAETLGKPRRAETGQPSQSLRVISCLLIASSISVGPTKTISRRRHPLWALSTESSREKAALSVCDARWPDYEHAGPRAHIGTGWHCPPEGGTSWTLWLLEEGTAPHSDWRLLRRSAVREPCGGDKAVGLPIRSSIPRLVTARKIERENSVSCIFGECLLTAP